MTDAVLPPVLNTTGSGDLDSKGCLSKTMTYLATCAPTCSPKHSVFIDQDEWMLPNLIILHNLSPFPISIQMTARCLVDVSSPSQSDAATGWSATVTGLISWSEASDKVIANTDNNATFWSHVQKGILRLFSQSEASDQHWQQHLAADHMFKKVFWDFSVD